MVLKAQAVRVLLVIAAVSLLSANSSASEGLVPTLTITIDQAAQTVNSTKEQPSVTFTGTVKVDKLPATKVTVTLVSNVDAGWASQVTPSTIVFKSSTSPEPFSCTVMIPQGTPNWTATLKIDGKAQGQGFISVASAQSIISVLGPANQSAAGGKTGTGGGTAGKEGGAAKASELDPVPIAVGAVVAAVACGGGGFYAIKLKKKKGLKTTE